jgi:myo-inositol 2-dehydrogenase/D-chiro-inositol 1-dehydrogenase
MSKVRVAMCGTGFVGNIHAQALKTCQDAEITALYSRNLPRGKKFAKMLGIPSVYTNYDRMLAESKADLVTLGIPNDLHCEFTIKAARAVKHVFVEKPLCITLEEADSMIAECKKNKVTLFYGENLPFAPKYVRLKELIAEGALGKVFYIRHRESHFGPHADWFWDVGRSGGGAFMDMGCHGIEFARWLLQRGNKKPRVRRISCSLGRYVHLKRTKGEDDAVAVLEFEGGARAVIENSWALRGGLDDRAEVMGPDGVAFADLVVGNAIRIFSATGYGYAVEKAPDTRGWTFAVYREHEMYGYPEEMAHVIECIQKNKKPVENAEDGRHVLETMFAGYASAKLGRWINLPFKPAKGKKPYQLWRG